MQQARFDARARGNSRNATGHVETYRRLNGIDKCSAYGMVLDGGKIRVPEAHAVPRGVFNGPGDVMAKQSGGGLNNHADEFCIQDSGRLSRRGNVRGGGRVHPGGENSENHQSRSRPQLWPHKSLPECQCVQRSA